MTEVIRTILDGVFSPIFEDGVPYRWEVCSWQHISGYTVTRAKDGSVTDVLYLGQRMPGFIGALLDRLTVWVDSSYTVHVDGGEGVPGCGVLRAIVKATVRDYIRRRVLTHNLARVKVCEENRFGLFDVPVGCLDDIKKELCSTTARLFIDGVEIRTMKPFREPLSTPGYQSADCSNGVVFGRHPSSGVFFKTSTAEDVA